MPDYLESGDRCLTVHAKQCFTEAIVKQCFTNESGDEAGVSVSSAVNYLKTVLQRFSDSCHLPSVYSDTQMETAGITAPAPKESAPADSNHKGTRQPSKSLDLSADALFSVLMSAD